MKNIRNISMTETTITPGPFGTSIVETNEVHETTITEVIRSRTGAKLVTTTVTTESESVDVLPPPVQRRPSIRDYAALADAFDERRVFLPLSWRAPPMQSIGIDNMPLRTFTPDKPLLDTGRTRDALTRPPETGVLDWILGQNEERKR